MASTDHPATLCVVVALLVSDIVLTFRTEIILSDGRSLRRPDEIAKHYFTTWFFLDLLLAIPFDLLVIAFTRKAPPLKVRNPKNTIQRQFLLFN